MATPKRARSGGPKSVAGLAISSGNSLKTGAYSVQTVLPGENTEHFETLEQQLIQEFEPLGMAEAAMVHDLAVLTWKNCA